MSDLKYMSDNEILGIMQEECAELIQAISKYRRANGDGIPTSLDRKTAYNNMVEELADVECCCKWLEKRLDCTEKIKKINRKKYKRNLRRLQKRADKE